MDFVIGCCGNENISSGRKNGSGDGLSMTKMY